MDTSSYMVLKENLAGSNDAYLISAVRQGDLEAFNQLVLYYQDRIYNLAARLLGDNDLAEDITQNTFLTAYLNLARFRNGSFRGWLYRIATNACYDVHRERKRHPIRSIEDKGLAEEKFLPIDDNYCFSSLPEKEFERHELEKTIQCALNRLNIDQRTIILLVDMQGFDYQGAAQVLGIPVGTVKSRLARARVELCEQLASAGHGGVGLAM
jgi:RNA polymerase sigma-70 factor, ECF subfamily